MVTSYRIQQRFVLVIILVALAAAAPVLMRVASTLLSNTGWSLLVRRSIPAAQRLFVLSDHLNPENGSAQLGLCRVGVEQGLVASAITCLQNAQVKAVARVSDLLLLGNLAREIGDSQLAVTAWRQAGAGPYFLGQAREASQTGDFSRALVLYQTAIEIDPALAQAYLDVGKLYFGMNEFTFAYEAFKTTVELKPDREGYAWLGRTLEALGQIDAALAAYSEAARQGELWYGYLAAGDLLRKAGDLNAAEMWYLRARDSYPKIILVLVRLGDIALLRKDFDKAREFFLTALHQSPNDPDALYAMARLSSVQGADQEVIAWTQRALEQGLQPDFWFHKMRGRSYRNLGQCALADLSYRAALASANIPANEKPFLLEQLEVIARDRCDVK